MVQVIPGLYLARHLNKLVVSRDKKQDTNHCFVKQSTFLILYESGNILFQQLSLNNQKQNQRPICRDYKAGNCRRDSCRFIHLDNREFWPLLPEFEQVVRHSHDVTGRFYVTSEYTRHMTFLRAFISCDVIAI